MPESGQHDDALDYVGPAEAFPRMRNLNFTLNYQFVEA